LRYEENEPVRMSKTPGTLPQVFFLPGTQKVWSGPSSGDANQPVLINRNFDPETRTLRKHQTNVEMEDTLESNVKGLAEEIIAEDEAKRAQDLVTVIFFHWNFHPIHPTREGSSEYCTKTAKLGSQKRNGEEIGETGKTDSAGHPYAHSSVMRDVFMLSPYAY
jgi:hypothetical protein